MIFMWKTKYTVNERWMLSVFTDISNLCPIRHTMRDECKNYLHFQKTIQNKMMNNVSWNYSKTLSKTNIRIFFERNVLEKDISSQKVYIIDKDMKQHNSLLLCLWGIIKLDNYVRSETLKSLAGKQLSTKLQNRVCSTPLLSECKSIQKYWNVLGQFHTKLSIHISWETSVSSWNIYSTVKHVHMNTFKTVFLVA